MGVGGAVRATGMSLIAPFFILYLRNILDLGYPEIGLLALLTGVVPLAIVPIAGLVTDRLGRRRLFLAALAGEAASMLGCAAAMQGHDLLALVVGVAVLQTVGTIGGPAISAYVADFVHGSERTLGFTWLRVGWNVGFTIGVFSGGALIGAVGFVEVGLLAGLCLASATAVLALMLDPSPYDRALAAPGPGAAGSARSPAVPFRQSLGVLGRDRPFLALCAATALGALAAGQWGSTFPIFVNTILKVPYLILGLGLALNGLLVVFAQTATTRAAIGHRHTSVLVVGILLYVAGFLLLGAVSLLVFAIVPMFFVVVFVLTMGENVMSVPTTTLPSNLAPPSEIGSYNGGFFALYGVGQILAPAIGGFVLSLGWDPLLTWAVLMVPALPATLLILRFVAPRLDAHANRA
jgi:MFS family permease